MKKYILILFLLFTACAQTNLQTSTQTNTPVLLSIGDSISLGYMNQLSTDLKKYLVVHPPENCRNSYYNSVNVKTWLSELRSTPHIVIWNTGIWNTLHNYLDVPIEQQQRTNEQYREELMQVAETLNATNAKIYFVTTTYITPNDSIFDANKVVELNAIAKDVMNEMNIQVIDIYDFSKTLESEKIDPVHFTSKGFSELGLFIERAIKK